MQWIQPAGEAQSRIVRVPSRRRCVRQSELAHKATLITSRTPFEQPMHQVCAETHRKASKLWQAHGDEAQSQKHDECAAKHEAARAKLVQLFGVQS